MDELVNTYQSRAKAYAEGVRHLFGGAPRDLGPDDLGSPAVNTTPADLPERAQALLVTSARLNDAAGAKLQHPDSAVRLEAATQLLAKALTDLQVAVFLQRATPPGVAAAVQTLSPDVSATPITLAEV